MSLFHVITYGTVKIKTKAPHRCEALFTFKLVRNLFRVS